VSVATTRILDVSRCASGDTSGGDGRNEYTDWWGKLGERSSHAFTMNMPAVDVRVNCKFWRSERMRFFTARVSECIGA